jgi:hypothetical protein
MKRIGDYDIEIVSTRIGGAWQAHGKMPDGKEVISAPKSSKQDAEHDVESQIRSRLYPQRRYDVNRPFESMNLSERKAKLGSGARFAKLERSLSHKKGIREPGAVAAAVGRKALGKERFQNLAATGRRRHSESLSPSEHAIMLHQADRLLEAATCECADPACPACGGRCQNRASTNLKRIDMDDLTGTMFCSACAEDALSSGLFARNISGYVTGSRHASARPKASFYPSDGGSGGGGGGISSV